MSAIKHRTAEPNALWIDSTRALDEDHIPNVAYIKDRLQRPFVVWWFTDAQGHVTEIVTDTRGALRNIATRS